MHIEKVFLNIMQFNNVKSSKAFLRDGGRKRKPAASNYGLPALVHLQHSNREVWHVRLVHLYSGS